MQIKEYIQNRTNWCWAAACKLAGQRYKDRHPEFRFTLDTSEVDYVNSEGQAIAITPEAEGIRPEIVKQVEHLYYVDAWQRAIVRNANTIAPSMEGNLPGDDNAKMRGLKYFLTGDCNSKVVGIENMGLFDMAESLLDFCEDRMRRIFTDENYIIGNAVLAPLGLCHSFVLLGWEGNNILVFDPWDGSVSRHDARAIFRRGFTSARGTGVIKWIQYIAGHSLQDISPKHQALRSERAENASVTPIIPCRPSADRKTASALPFPPSSP